MPAPFVPRVIVSFSVWLFFSRGAIAETSGASQLLVALRKIRKGQQMRKRLQEDGRKLFADTIEAADPRELVVKWSLCLATAERVVYFATLAARS